MYTTSIGTYRICTNYGHRRRLLNVFMDILFYNFYLRVVSLTVEHFRFSNGVLVHFWL